MNNEIHADETMTIGHALAYMTDAWIADGNYCEQTVLDLRDVCRRLIDERGKATDVVDPCGCILRLYTKIIPCDEHQGGAE